MPDTPVSTLLRKHQPYNEYLIHKLADMFGSDFLECGDVELIKQGLEWMKEVEDKAKITGRK